jgi:hypothetical protein
VDLVVETLKQRWSHYENPNIVHKPLSFIAVDISESQEKIPIYRIHLE